MNIKRSFLIWLGKQLPPCNEMTKLASDSLQRKLSLKEKIQLKLHVLNCILCKRYGEQIIFLRTAAHALEEDGHSDHHLSTEARNKMKQALREQME